MAFVEELPRRWCAICHQPIWHWQLKKDVIFGWHKKCLKVSKEGKHFIEYETPSGGHIRMIR